MTVSSAVKKVCRTVPESTFFDTVHTYGTDYINDYNAILNAGGKLPADNNKLTFTAQDTGDGSYYFADFGSGFFNSDFKSVTKFNFSVIDDDAPGIGFSGISTGAGSILGIIIAGVNVITLSLLTSGSQTQIGITEIHASTPYSSSMVNVSKSTDYWSVLKLGRIAATAYLDVYSDSSLSALVGSTSLVMQSVPDYRYLCGVTTVGLGSGKEYTGTIEDLNWSLNI